MTPTAGEGSPSDGVRSKGRAGTMMAAAVGVMNVATYAFTMVAARFLGPQSYGAFASVMNILLVVSVLSLGLQATAARRISASPDHVAEIERSMARITLRAGLVLGLLCLVAAPAINWGLRLHSLPASVLVAVCAVPMTVMGTQAGILQGERRWKPLAILYLANGLPRLVIGIGLMLIEPNEFQAILGVTIGWCAPVLVGWWALRRPREGHETSGHHGARSVIRETVHNSHALLAFFALSNVDLLVARNVLDAQQAGLYAAGLIVVKAVLFLPQFVVVVAFPSLSNENARRRTLLLSILGVGGVGLACAAGAFLLSGLALVFAGGRQYADIQGILWAFAIIGTFQSLLQLLVYSVLAEQSRRAVYFVWAAVVAVLLGGQLIATYRQLLVTVLIVDAVLVAVLLVVSIRRLPAPAGESELLEAVDDAHQ